MTANLALISAGQAAIATSIGAQRSSYAGLRGNTSTEDSVLGTFVERSYFVSVEISAENRARLFNS